MPLFGTEMHQSVFIILVGGLYSDPLGELKLSPKPIAAAK